jgi:hypothetical protein
MTRGIRLTGFLALALLAALVVFLSSDDTRAAPPPFEPGGILCFENFESAGECDGDSQPGAAADLRSKFCVGWSSDCGTKNSSVNDSNFGGIVAFTPTDWTLPQGDTIPIGAIAGRLESEATLGLLNNACNNRIQVAFTMMNASININDTIAPRPEGETDVMQPLAMDANGNGVPDGADKYPSFLAEFFKVDGTVIQPRARLFGISNIQSSWVTLNFIFFEPGTTIDVAQTRITFNSALGYPSITILQDPVAQAAPGAITDFCAPLLSENITLGKTINNPCAPTTVAGANCPVTTDVAPDIKELGYPSFPCDNRSKFDDDGDGKINDGCPQVNDIAETGAECDNDVSDDTEDSAINDGCPPFGDVSEGARIDGVCSGGDEGGCTYRANPAAAGTYSATTLALSQRDADGDGIENSLDVCFETANSEWNPRAPDPVNDTDNDGLPNVCDPAPTTTSPGSPTGCKSGYTGPDHDQDCFSNRADNCPTDISLEDPTKPPDENTNKPLAPDADKDAIGDACDPDVNAVNGEYIGYCIKFALNVGGAAGAVTGVRENAKAPDCAAQGPVIAPPTGAGIVAASPTPRPAGASGSNTGTGGVDGGPVSGVGSLSPTATDFPVWAAILAGFGAAGLVSGLALYARVNPRRQR